MNGSTNYVELLGQDLALVELLDQCVEQSFRVSLDCKAAKFLRGVAVDWGNRCIWINISGRVDSRFGVGPHLVGWHKVRGLVWGVSFLAVCLLEHSVISNLLMMVVKGRLGMWDKMLVAVHMLRDEATLRAVLVLLHVRMVHLLLECQERPVDCHNVARVIVGEINSSCHWRRVNAKTYRSRVLVNLWRSWGLVDALGVLLLSLLVLNACRVKWIRFHSAAPCYSSMQTSRVVQVWWDLSCCEVRRLLSNVTVSKRWWRLKVPLCKCLVVNQLLLSEISPLAILKDILLIVGVSLWRYSYRILLEVHVLSSQLNLGMNFFVYVIWVEVNWDSVVHHLRVACVLFLRWACKLDLRCKASCVRRLVAVNSVVLGSLVVTGVKLVGVVVWRVLGLLLEISFWKSWVAASRDSRMRFKIFIVGGQLVLDRLRVNWPFICFCELVERVCSHLWPLYRPLVLMVPSSAYIDKCRLIEPSVLVLKVRILNLLIRNFRRLKDISIFVKLVLVVRVVFEVWSHWI